MIFKKYRDIIQYIQSVEKYDGSLTKLREKLESDLKNGFKILQFQFLQETDYSVDIYGSVKPVLGEMRDSQTVITDSAGREVCNHIVNFIAKRLPDGTYLTPENVVFKIDTTPKTKNDYQKMTVVELLEVRSAQDVPQGGLNV